MKLDIRLTAAKYYDLNPNFPPDVPFYQALIPSPQATILELGCGTGRVTLPLARQCRFIRGIDLSPAMIDVCRAKLARAGIKSDQAAVTIGDITAIDLGQTFDLIVAPFRVMQNLESDAEVNGLFEVIGRHLAPGGTCVLNVFRPNYPPDELARRWLVPGENLNWEVPIEGGKVVCYDRRARIDQQHMALYPDLIYRCYKADVLVEEVVLHLVMRCYYADTFAELITAHGFQVMNRWGGYRGEPYGEGPELVVQFRTA